MNVDNVECKCEICNISISNLHLTACPKCSCLCCRQCRENWVLQRPPNAFFQTPCLYNCGYIMDHTELLDIAGANRFEKMQLRAASDANTYYCPIPDCEYAGFWMGEEEEGEFPSTVCECCNKSRCILCGIIPYHDGKTCREAEESMMSSTDSLLCAADIAKLGVKRCPRCREGVQKKQRTCNKMSCRCGYKFCFKCSAKDSSCTCTGKEHSFWDNQRNCIMEEVEFVGPGAIGTESGSTEHQVMQSSSLISPETATTVTGKSSKTKRRIAEVL